MSKFEQIELEDIENIKKQMDDSNIKYEYLEIYDGISEYRIGKEVIINIDNMDAKHSAIKDINTLKDIAKKENAVYRTYYNADYLSKDLKYKFNTQLGLDLKLRVAKSDTKDINGNEIKEGESIIQLRDRILTSYNPETSKINNPFGEKQLGQELRAYRIYTQADRELGIEKKDFDNIYDYKTYMSSNFDVDIYTTKEQDGSSKIKMGGKTIGETFKNSINIKWNSNLSKLSEIAEVYSLELAIKKDNQKIFADVWNKVVDNYFEGDESEMSIVKKLSKEGYDKELIETTIKLEQYSRDGDINLSDKQIETMDLSKAVYFIEKVEKSNKTLEENNVSKKVEEKKEVINNESRIKEVEEKISNFRLTAVDKMNYNLVSEWENLSKDKLHFSYFVAEHSYALNKTLEKIENKSSMSGEEYTNLMFEKVSDYFKDYRNKLETSKDISVVDKLFKQLDDLKQGKTVINEKTTSEKIKVKPNDVIEAVKKTAAVKKQSVEEVVNKVDKETREEKKSSLTKQMKELEGDVKDYNKEVNKFNKSYGDKPTTDKEDNSNKKKNK